MKSVVRDQQGISLIEIVIASGLLLLVGGALVQLGITSIRTADGSRARAVALQMADEALEVGRYVRDNDPNTFFAISGNRTVDPATNILGATSCSPTTVPFSPPGSNSCEVNVDLSGASVTFWRVIRIVDTPGVTNSKNVTAYVFWDNSGSYSNVSTSTILTRWKN